VRNVKRKTSLFLALAVITVYDVLRKGPRRMRGLQPWPTCDELGIYGRDMSEQRDDNPPAQESTEIERFDDDFVPDDARPLCPRCLTPCRPLQYYCHNCGSNDAINPLTPYIAFLNIRFNYDIFCTMWRRIWYDEHSLMVSRLFYLLMITAFVPVIVVFGLPLLFIGRIPQPALRAATTIFLCIIAVVLFVLFVRYGLFTGLMRGPLLR
jgi:hypothetical protein